AFGAHISPLHALVLGMIPDCDTDRVTSAGNAAGTGARMALLNAAARREIEHIVRTVEKIETAVEEKFQDHFVGAIAVPHKTQPYPKLSAEIAIPASVRMPEMPEEEGGRRRRRRRG
ncbi:MAG: ASKHA domain-containing protein, partial [Pseudomonadota bacterium]